MLNQTFTLFVLNPTSPLASFLPKEAKGTRTGAGTARLSARKMFLCTVQYCSAVVQCYWHILPRKLFAEL